MVGSGKTRHSISVPTSLTPPHDIDELLRVIEIDIGAARVRLRGSVDEASVRCVLQTLRGIA